MSTIYSDAVRSIREYSEGEQARLDNKAAAARVKTITQLRIYATEGLLPDNPEFFIADLLAHTIDCGRESDGFPDITIPKDTQEALKAAWGAGMFKYCRVGSLEFYADFSGLTHKPECWYADYQAWDNARAYRDSQTWSKL